MDPRVKVDPRRCPLCGEANACAVASGQPPESCWCMSASMPPKLLALVPADAAGKACICAACVKRFHAGTLPVVSNR